MTPRFTARSKSWPALAFALAAIALAGCPREREVAPIPSGGPSLPSAPPPTARDAAPTPPPTASLEPAIDAGAPVPAEWRDPMALHTMDAKELFRLGGEPPRQERLFAPAAGRWNQGNRAIARHTISKQACLEGLRGIPLQTPEQRERCGADNMVPIWRGSDPSQAKACIDIFEYPNLACELPMVWGSPAQAQSVCKALGKRLCTQDEWQLGCGGDPAGGKPTLYAYGDTLDLTLCHTNRSHAENNAASGVRCNPSGARTAWETCVTGTEPSGAFPRCRSRFGVFDQHGNVAEEMTRKTAEGAVVTQLKGSAFFYTDVWREPGKPPPKARCAGPIRIIATTTRGGTSSRWSARFHVNYHLGFRCCKDVP